jgi:hypothetical protein
VCDLHGRFWSLAALLQFLIVWALGSVTDEKLDLGRSGANRENIGKSILYPYGIALAITLIPPFHGGIFNNSAIVWYLLCYEEQI